MWNDDVMFEYEFLSEQKKNYVLCISTCKKNIDGLRI